MKRNRRIGRVHIRGQATGVVSHAGTELLYRTAGVTGLSSALSSQLAPFALRGAVHDPGKIILDLIVMLAAGGDCPTDTSMLRASAVAAPVASDPTISRLMHRLAEHPEGLATLRQASALARKGAGRHAAGSAAADPATELVVGVDATLITAHSDKEDAAPTYKRGYGFHPLLAYADHGAGGTGEPVAGILRPGNANAGTAADHEQILDLITDRLTATELTRLVVRTDTAACTHNFLHLLTDRNHGYSVGFYARGAVAAALDQLRDDHWIPTIDNDDREIRDGGWVAEITDLLSLSQWPKGMRVIVRKERPHPGAQLRLTDVDGHRITCFATNHPSTDLAWLDLRHRRRARCEDRIRHAKDTGGRNLPYRDFTANQIWLQLVMLAQALLAHLQQLALSGELAVAEPKRLRLRIFSVAARLIRTGRRRILDLDRHWPWTPAILNAAARLDALTA